MVGAKRLKRKYGPTLEDVMARHESMTHELEQLGRAGERAAELEAIVGCARDRYLALAADLSAVRRQAATELAADLEREVASLAMEHTRFEVRFEEELPEARWSERGIDAAQFYVSPNPGEELRALARIASGGELSRIMLALKTIATTDVPGKTLIFDEVDAGIGGRVADAVGSRLQALADGFQVLCITHLPQIAAHAGCQFRVAKAVQSGRTTTSVEPLREKQARIEELARMIAGAAVTPATLAGAAEMLESRSGRASSSNAPAGAKGESEQQAKAKVPERRSRAKGER
jgi:DNA repair protein RecN (Recombination protein N)